MLRPCRRHLTSRSGCLSEPPGRRRDRPVHHLQIGVYVPDSRQLLQLHPEV